MKNHFLSFLNQDSQYYQRQHTEYTGKNHQNHKGLNKSHIPLIGNILKAYQNTYSHHDSPKNSIGLYRPYLAFASQYQLVLQLLGPSGWGQISYPASQTFLKGYNYPLMKIRCLSVIPAPLGGSWRQGSGFAILLMKFNGPKALT